MLATFVSSTSFRVVGDYTAIFNEGRRVKMNCGLSGFKYGTVTSSAYAAPNTTVSLKTTSDAIDSNLTEVGWGRVKPGLQGNQANRLIDGDTYWWFTAETTTFRKASSTAGDGPADVIQRAKGSLGNPALVSTAVYLYEKYIQGYAGASPAYQTVLAEIFDVVSVSDTHVLARQTIQMDNGDTGLVTTEIQWGNGIHSFPNQSMIRVSRNSAWAVNSGVETLVVWDDEDYDLQDEYDPSSGACEFLATQDGYYHVDALVHLDTGATAGVFSIRAKIDGTIIQEETYIKSTTNAKLALKLSFDTQLALGEALSVYLEQATGSNFNMTAVAAENVLTIHKYA